MKRSTLAFASIAAIALAMPLAAQAGPGKGHRGHGAHLMQMDTNSDGEITRAEAEVELANRFATIDAMVSAIASWIGTTTAAKSIVFQNAVPNFQ